MESRVKMDGELNKEVQALTSKVQALTSKVQVLNSKLQESYRRYNSIQLVIGLFYTVISTFVLFFVERGITVFSASQVYPTLVRVSLDVAAACFILPMVGSLIALYYRSYRYSEEKIGSFDKSPQDAYLAVNDDERVPGDTKETWGQWFKRQYDYFTTPEIMRRYAICWAIHALSISVHIAFSCFAVKGIYSIVKGHFPHPEWHNAMIYTLICAVFLMVAVCDAIFYYSVSQMIWWNVNTAQEKPGEKLTDVAVGSIKSKQSFVS